MRIVLVIALMGLVAGFYLITRPQPTYAEWQRTQAQQLQYAPNVVQVAPNTVQNTINGNQLQGGR